MTNNHLTDKRLAQLAKRNFCQTRGEEYTPFGDEVVSMAAELQERRKAEMDSEPYGFTDGDRRGMIYDPQYADRLNNPLPVYRHAQPAPVVTFYRDGIEAAAKWIDQLREAYDSEHGRHDPDTGSFEFGNDVQREYSSTLGELAEGIRALHPNAGMNPAAVVPEDIPDSVYEILCQACGGKAWMYSDALWDACRAAMFNDKAKTVSDGFSSDEIACDICGHVSTEPEGRHHCCEDNSND